MAVILAIALVGCDGNSDHQVNDSQRELAAATAQQRIASYCADKTSGRTPTPPSASVDRLVALVRKHPEMRRELIDAADTLDGCNATLRQKLDRELHP